MSYKTALAVYNKLHKGLQFCDYFIYIDTEDINRKIITYCLTDKVVEFFFGFLTEKSRTRNPSFLKAARVIANDAFFYLLTFISDSRDAGVTIRRTKDERLEKYYRDRQ